jgi:arginase
VAFSSVINTIMSEKPKITVTGFPTEAGTHFAGQCKAPEALVSTGELLSKLATQYEVEHIPNIFATNEQVNNAARWAASAKSNGIRNEGNALAVMHYIKDELIQKADKQGGLGGIQLFLGGDCSIAPSILCAMQHISSSKIGVIYFDGDCDLSLPGDSHDPGRSGILDSMVLSHYTQRTGCLDSIKNAFAKPDGSPMVDPSNIVLYGQDPLQPSVEHWEYLCENQFKCFFRSTVAANPAATARAALKYLSTQGCEAIFIHFDVDVIDSGEFPLANFPHYAGLQFGQASEALKVFLSEAKNLLGLTLTEVNPNNDPSGEMVTRLVDTIVKGLHLRLDAER